MPQQALAGVRVLDLSTEIGGVYCTKLLADLGATVVMVERPTGHPLRGHGPFPDGEPHAEKSGMFLHLCANKHGLKADLETPEGRARVLDFASGADLLVETFPLGYLADLGLDYQSLVTRNPALVLTSITHFGQTGPYRDWQGEEIVDYALGGYLYLGGDKDREPLMVHDNQSQFHAGAQGALASLSALWWAQRTGQGQQIDVSAVEAMLSAHNWTSVKWTHEGIVCKRSSSPGVQCRDGWVMFAGLQWYHPLFVLIESPELADDPRFADLVGTVEFDHEGFDLIREWCLGQPVEEVVQRAQQLRIAVTPVNDPADLLCWDHLRERDWWLKSDHPVAGPVTLPGYPYKLSETPPALRRHAPVLGEEISRWPDREDLPKPTPFRERPTIEPTPEPDPPLPLTGIRILELTSNWAGPLGGRYLADLGIESIKGEIPDRPWNRQSHLAGGQAFRRFYDRAGYFNKLNRGKYGMTVDIASTEGRDLVLRLAREVDVVLENSSPRVMRNLGLDYAALSKVNSDLVMVSILGFGQYGPARDYFAYGTNIEASSGLMATTGYADDPRPFGTTLYYADPVTAPHTSIAILAALFHRQRTGQGQYIDIALQETTMGFMAESLLEPAMTGSNAARRDNRHRSHAPQGCYPSMGDDMWMVLCVRGDDDWRRFREVVDDPTLDDPRFGSEAGRRAHHDELDGIIAEWSSGLDHNEAAAQLQAAGVPAAPVLANWEMVSNPHIFERGFYLPVGHPEMGVFPYPGMPWKLSVTPGRVRRAAPLYGQHNRLIFGEWLGVSDAELAALFERRVLTDESPPDFRPSAPYRL